MIKKVFISANELLEKSFELARKIWDDGYYPNFLVGIWRGGTPPGIVIHEFFVYKGMKLYHTSIKTQSYTGIMSCGPVEIKGIEHVIDIINSEDRMLIVDDVFDTGQTMAEVVKAIKKKARKNTPEIRIGTVFYKPTRNQTDVVPDYYVEVNDNWLVFPHELEGLTKEEINEKNPRIYGHLFDRSGRGSE